MTPPWWVLLGAGALLAAYVIGGWVRDIGRDHIRRLEAELDEAERIGHDLTNKRLHQAEQSSEEGQLWLVTWSPN